LQKYLKHVFAVNYVGFSNVVIDKWGVSSQHLLRVFADLPSVVIVLATCAMPKNTVLESFIDAGNLPEVHLLQADV
jgi:hypothetical protein